MCNTPEDFKAWSQNLGHEEVLTTFYSYGEVPVQRQSEIIRSLGTAEDSESQDMKLLIKKVVRELKLNAVEEG
jgi:hypothetical protein